MSRTTNTLPISWMNHVCSATLQLVHGTTAPTSSCDCVNDHHWIRLITLIKPHCDVTALQRKQGNDTPHTPSWKCTQTVFGWGFTRTMQGKLKPTLPQIPTLIDWRTGEGDNTFLFPLDAFGGSRGAPSARDGPRPLTVSRRHWKHGLWKVLDSDPMWSISETEVPRILLWLLHVAAYAMVCLLAAPQI